MKQVQFGKKENNLISVRMLDRDVYLKKFD